MRTGRGILLERLNTGLARADSSSIEDRVRPPGGSWMKFELMLEFSYATRPAVEPHLFDFYLK